MGKISDKKRCLDDVHVRVHMPENAYAHVRHTGLDDKRHEHGDACVCVCVCVCVYMMVCSPRASSGSLLQVLRIINEPTAAALAYGMGMHVSCVLDISYRLYVLCVLDISFRRRRLPMAWYGVQRNQNVCMRGYQKHSIRSRVLSGACRDAL